MVWYCTLPSVLSYTAMMELDPGMRRHLRGLCHHLAPIVTIAEKGITAAILAELDAALLRHELIKVKIRAPREARTAAIEQLVAESGAALVQRIGQTACLYRRHPEKPRLVVPG